MMRLELLTAALAASFLLTAAAEAPYGFRERLEEVHQKNVRNESVKPAADDFVFGDGALIALSGDAADDFMLRVAQDFEDYLKTSMNVEAAVTTRPSSAGKYAVTASLDKSLREREYRCIVTKDGARLTARDVRTLAQAFYHLEDLMNLRRAPYLKIGKETRRMRFETRLSHSGYGYMMYPEAMLNHLAHAGINSIIVYVCGLDMGERGRVFDQRAIIRSAAKYGIDAYLYSEVPVFFHPDDGDANFENAYGKIAESYPDAKGIILVGESCQFPSKDPRVRPITYRMSRANPDPTDKRPLAGWFPCTDYPDWLAAVQRVFDRHSNGTKTVFWTYNWGWADEKDRIALIDKLPAGSILQATFEMFEKQKKSNGLECPTADYSLSTIGPGKYFSSEAKRAKERGLKLFTQANAGGRTWDFGTAPIEPFPFQWRARWEALVKANRDWNLTGVMENHHYGWSPSFLAELEKEAYTEGGMPFEEHLRAIAARDFGEENADKAVAAWKLWSEAIADYVPTDLNQYGTFRCGSAYPYTPGRERFVEKGYGDKSKGDPTGFPVTQQSLVGRGFIRMNYIDRGFVPELTKERNDTEYLLKECELLDGMIAKLDAGVDAFAAMKGEKAAAMARLGKYLACDCRTAANVKRGWAAADMKDEAAILKYAKAEYANAKTALELVETDSHLGWEPTMDYVGGPDQIRWKLALMEKLYGKENLK